MEAKHVFVIVLGLFLSVVLLKQSDMLDDYLQLADERSSLAYEHADEEIVPDGVKNEAPDSVSAAVDDAELKQMIESEAKARQIAPINAKLDRVWKAIPGYNGLEVDVEKTIELIRKTGLQKPLPLVLREVEPTIQLSDLGAHPIYKGNPNKRMVSLMINVAWGNEYLGPMLDILEQEQVKATFFFDGSWLSKNLETAKQIQDKGHELSNHAYSHKMMSQLSRSKATEEIMKTQTLLKDELGVDNQLFAPPAGDFHQETVQIAHELGMKTVLWTLDTVDWKKPSPSSIIQKISARLEPGAMILMHPTSSSSEALSGMIAEIKKQGMSIGTVSELLSSKRLPDLSDSARSSIE
jgi:probable sporulation protein (polysaccharide deacetylase family)